VAAPRGSPGEGNSSRLEEFIGTAAATTMRLVEKDARGPNNGVAVVSECRKRVFFLAVAGMLLLGSAVKSSANYPSMSINPVSAVRDEQTGVVVIAAQSPAAALRMLTLSESSHQPATASQAYRIAQAWGDEVNAPWADLLAARPRASGTTEEPTKTGRTSGPPSQPDASPTPLQADQVPVAATPPPVVVEKSLPSVPPAHAQPELGSAPHAIAQPRAGKTKDGLSARVQRQGRAHTRQKRQEPHLRHAQTRRQERSALRDVAPAPARQLPQGLIPNHATPTK
jgi:hypothetical protein